MNADTAEKLISGGVGVLPTDTIYGIVARALDRDAVNKLYDLKRRRPDKPFIILISNISQLSDFFINLSKDQKELLKDVWPGPVSVILPCESAKLDYLHRGHFSLAFRLPAKESLRVLIESSGPLVAPSANPEGLPPATTREEAWEYFHEDVDFIIDGGKVSGKPSRLIKFSDGKTEVLRA